MNIRTVLAAAALSALSFAAVAQTATPGVDQRQANQEARIQQGVASGELTPRETRRLRAEQRTVARAKADAKADGVVTPQERARLQHMQNQASRDIRHQKHDRQRAASAP